MENNELTEAKRELYKEIDELKYDYKSFKRRVSVLTNLIIPGIGFLVYGSSYSKGIISFILFVSYNLIYFIKLRPIMYIEGWIFYYIPAVVIWIVSAAMVAGLDD